MDRDHYNRLHLADQLSSAQSAVAQADALRAQHPDWAQGNNIPHEGSGLGCQKPYEQTDGRAYFLPDEVAANVPVSEQQWAAIQEAAKEAAAKIDATDIQVMHDNPGNHDVGFYGPTGIFIKVGYRGNLVVSGYTGCRLPRDKK